jgi:hypothetical protein
MKYLLSIYTDESGFADVTPEQAADMTAAYIALSREMEQAGVALGGEGLQPTATATTVRLRDGERLLTDGPFAETREALGGFYLIDVEDLDAALGWAAKVPGAAWGSVEVRPVMTYEGAAESPSADRGAAAAG